MMTKEMQSFVEAEVKKLLAAPSACKEAKAAGESWLAAAGTEREAEETKKLIAELEMDIMPIDGLVAFASSPAATEIFGAAGFLKHAQELKAGGAKYCDCPACTACAAILAKKSALV